MTVQVHYGGVRYNVKGRDANANAIAGEIAEIIATGNDAEAYHFESDEGLVTIFPALGAVAIVEVKPRRTPPPPAPAVLSRDPQNGPSIRDIQF